LAPGVGLVQELRAGDPRLIGSYRLVGRLGSGGMGKVFLGLSAGGRLVAVKVIRDDLAEDPEFRARFRREVAAARSVSGLFTAPVVDAETDGTEPWLATAYVPGLSLAEAVRVDGPLPAASMLALAAGLAEGLAAIHSAGVVHRDLKPSNVLLAEDGPRVIDFGISRATEASAVTRTGLVFGSPGFMSPEQAEGGEVGPASDVFSLGAVLTFAATGEGPFGTGSTAALAYRVVHGPANLDRVPAQVRPLVERCLAKDPGQRPDPRELLAQLGHTGFAAGWLPPAVVEAFPQLSLPAVEAEPSLAGGTEDKPAWAATEGALMACAAGDAPATVTGEKQPGSVEPPPGPAQVGGINGEAPQRRRRRRVVLAWLIPALVVAAAAVAFGLDRSDGGRAATAGQLETTTRTATAGLTQQAVGPAPSAISSARASATGSARPSATAGGAPSATSGGQPSAASSGPQPSAKASSSQPNTGPAATAPGRPVSITATAAGQYSIKVSWADSSAGITGFHIDNGCPVGSCSPGAALAKTTGAVTSATFGVTPGTYQCFRVQAYNNAGTSPWSAYGCTSTPSLVVAGSQEWTSTNVTVAAGDSLGITATGQVYIDPQYPVGPGGDRSCIPSRDHPGGAFPGLDLPCWSLIARIGNGTPFEVGTSTLVTAGASGTLYLGVNDDNFADNSGSWTVNIKLGGLPPSP